jgi:hypothetical protein
MAGNFTEEHGLVEEISSKGWFANPAGRQGYEVIVLEQVGDGGTRFYAVLKPGETLRLSERVLGKFMARAVDVRYARSFPIQGQFSSQDRGRKVSLHANVRYRVTDARVVAMETIDPLGELRNKVIAILNRELIRYSEVEVTPGLIERIISSVGPVPNLGLTVEGAEVLEFSSDSRITQQVLEEEDLRHKLSIGGIQEQAEIDSVARKQEADLQLKQTRYSSVDLSDINILMHEHPDMVQTIFSTFTQRDQKMLTAQNEVVAAAVKAYIEQQRENEAEIDPEEIARIMRRSMSPSQGQFATPANRQIVWGNDRIVDALPVDSDVPAKPRVEFEDDIEGKPQERKPPSDPDRIKFG